MVLLDVLDNLLGQIANLQDRIYNEQIACNELNNSSFDEENAELLDCLKVVTCHVENHHNNLSQGRSVAKNAQKHHSMSHTSIASSAETWRVTLLTVVDTLAHRPTIAQLQREEQERNFEVQQEVSERSE